MADVITAYTQLRISARDLQVWRIPAADDSLAMTARRLMRRMIRARYWAADNSWGEDLRWAFKRANVFLLFMGFFCLFI